MKNFNIILITYHADGTKTKEIVDQTKGIREANEICRMNNTTHSNDCVYLVEEIEVNHE